MTLKPYVTNRCLSKRISEMRANLFDSVVFVRGEEVLGAVRVEARGAVQ